MFTNRLFVLVIAVALAFAAAFVIREGIATRAVVSTAGGLDDFALRHPDLSIPVPSPQVDNTGSDYFQRHGAELSASRAPDTSDYAVRHPELSAPSARQVDLTDYYFRHPELSTALNQP